MCENPLFSILCTNFNNGPYIRTMVDSVLAQTYQNWELIFVDDGSSDDSASIISEYYDPRIRTEFLQQNQGAGAAAEIAALMSRGQILGRLDADDALTPDAISVMIQTHQSNPDVSLITSQIISCSPNLVPTDTSWYKNKPVPPGSCILKNPTVGHFATFKRSAYDTCSGFNRTLKRAVDLDLYLKLEETGLILMIPNKLYLYRKNPNGISQGCNGILAQALAYQVMIDAHFRRTKSGADNNIPRGTASKLRLKQHQIELHQKYTGASAVLSFWKAIRLFPELAINPTMWRNTLSAIARKTRQQKR